MAEHDRVKSNLREQLSAVFSRYLWFGIVILLLAIVLDLKYPGRGFLLSMIIKLLESIGVAVVIAYIFTFVSGTSEFVQKISTLLQSIVIGRNFLGNIDAESKREALNSLIKPSTAERRVYSNIEDYLNTYINNTMDVTNKCVRSNYTINARAFLENGVVYVRSRIAYRLYPKKDGYDAIKVGFLAEEKLSRCVHLSINTPKGEREVFDEHAITLEEKQIHAGKARIATIDLSKYASASTHLDIAIELIESNGSSTMLLPFCTFMPTDGFRHHITCEPGLEVKSVNTFVYGASMYVDRRSAVEVDTSCTEWINEGTGISLLIVPQSTTPV